MSLAPPSGVEPEPVRPGQESVWAYPRPARAEAVSSHLLIVHAGRTVAETRQGVRTLETSHPPSYYFPPQDIAPGVLKRTRRGSICEWKGQAVYYDVMLSDKVVPDGAWSYPGPSAAFALLRDFVAFYAGPFDACFVDGERVTPQAGGFYGGWITSRVAGPFKGGPGSRFW